MQWLKLVEDFNQSLKVNLVRQNSLLRNEWDYSQQWSARWSCPELYCKFKIIYPDDIQKSTTVFRFIINYCSLPSNEHLKLSVRNAFFVLLQEIGDVENWAKSIERDMRTISSRSRICLQGG